MTDDHDTLDSRHQQHVIELADDLHELDTALLAQLTPADRARQARARHALWLHADAMWDAVKHTLPDSGPATRDAYNCVAALRDLTMELQAAATQAQHDAGDPDDDGQGDVAMWAESRYARGVTPPRYTLPDRTRHAGR
ncbi:hypothetical protein [Nonomuraea roseola]|uniref:DUF4254 domain-containing protein n=1 Tax=Nonomuraea roseola TaxID=46179 RepID=A0ABV5QB24_9ACTN